MRTKGLTLIEAAITEKLGSCNADALDYAAELFSKRMGRPVSDFNKISEFAIIRWYTIAKVDLSRRKDKTLKLLANKCLTERAAFLFRQGTGHTEKDFKVDEHLVERIESMGLRVHDLMEMAFPGEEG